MNNLNIVPCFAVSAQFAQFENYSHPAQNGLIKLCTHNKIKYFRNRNALGPVNNVYFSTPSFLHRCITHLDISVVIIYSAINIYTVLLHISSYILTPCEASMCTPVMVAVAAGRTDCVKELIVMGVPLNMADHQGENVFHYAARVHDPEIIKVSINS